jgi:carboxymethylenebutenolidase
MAGIVTADITFASNGGTAQGYVARPDDGATHPGVIVIQEWWGLDDHIKDITRRFANAGFVALAPDLYHGTVVPVGEPNEAQKAMMAMDQAVVAQDLRGAMTTLSNMSDVAPKQVGVVGFCMGGFITMNVASQAGSNIGAAVAFYPGGYNPTEQEVAAIQAPVLIIYASEDHSTPAEKREQLRQWLTDNGKTFDMVIYQGRDHAFFNDTRPEIHDPSDSADAWQRTINWFTRYLK